MNDDASKARPSRRKKAPLKGGKEAGAYHHGNLRRALLEAAVALIEKEGSRALTLRAAARLAGVSEAAPYRHFADKEALLAAVAEEGFRAMTAEMDRASEGLGESPALKLQRIGAAYVRYAAENPARFRVMTSPEAADKSRYPGLKDAAEQAFSRLMGALKDCQAAGAVRPGDPRRLALGAWSLVHGLSALLIDGQLTGFYAEDAGPGARDALIDKTAALLFTGLAPR